MLDLGFMFGNFPAYMSIIKEKHSVNRNVGVQPDNIDDLSYR